MNRKLLYFAVLALAGLSPAALAADPSRCSAQEPDQCLNGVSGSVTSLDSLRVRGVRPERVEEEQDRHRQSGLRPARLAASGNVSEVMGGALSGWAVWAAASTADFAGSVPVAPWDADLESLTIGADRLIGERLSLGGALLGEKMRTRTRFNGGGQKVDGHTLLVYGSYLLNDTFSVDANAGWGRLGTDQNRLDPATTPGAPNVLVASYDSSRTLWSVNLNAARQVGAWTLGGRLGYQDTKERQDGYRESGGPSARLVRDRTVSLKQASFGADAAYGFHRNWQLYASLVLRRDLSRDDGRSGGGLPNTTGATTSSDRTELEWALGARLYASTRFIATLEYLKTTGRESFSHDAWMLMARFDL
jgi:hypothetical protein